MVSFDCNLTYFDTAASLNGFSHIWSESIKMTKSGKRWGQGINHDVFPNLGGFTALELPAA